MKRTHGNDDLMGGDLPYGPLTYLVDRKEIVYLGVLFEAYEHIGAVRTVNPVRAVIEILYAPDFYHDAVVLMEGLKGEIPSLARVKDPAAP
ncbi:MAG: DUF4911 domain-containing protein [Leptospirillia bacterium]